MKVGSCSALVCIWIYLKSVLRYLFNFGYLSSVHSIFTWALVWGFVVILRIRKVCAKKKTLENN